MHVLLLAPVLAAIAAAAPPVRWEAGPVEFTFHRSTAAQRFHVIDQLAEWGDYQHKQYAVALAANAALALTPDERGLLDGHRHLRHRLGGYGLLEKIHYRDGDAREALRTAVAARQLTSAEAKLEQDLVTTLGPKVDALLASNQPAVDAFVANLEKRRDEFTTFARRASRFCLGAKIHIEAFLIASPTAHGGGGGFNGGVFTVEIGADAEALDVFIHETWHALVNAHRDLLLAADAANLGLGFETISEGLAHAVSPGVYHSGPPGEDPLARQVARDVAAHKRWNDANARFDRFGLALRPLLSAALDDPGQTLATFLPRAIDVWQATRALSEALDSEPVSKYSILPQFWIFGPRAGSDTLFHHIAALHVGNITSRGLEEVNLEECLPKMRNRDRIALMVTPETWARLPAGYQRFVGDAKSDLDAAAAAHKSLEREVKLGEQLVLWMMASDDAGLDAIGAKSTTMELLLPPKKTGPDK